MPLSASLILSFFSVYINPAMEDLIFLSTAPISASPIPFITNTAKTAKSPNIIKYNPAVPAVRFLNTFFLSLLHINCFFDILSKKPCSLSTAGLTMYENMAAIISGENIRTRYSRKCSVVLITSGAFLSTKEMAYMAISVIIT